MSSPEYSLSTHNWTITQNGIYQHPTQQYWLLNTEKSSYTLGIDKDGLVLQTYWGPRLLTLADIPEPPRTLKRADQDPDPTNLPEAYPVYGGLRYREIAAQATFADGTRDLDLRFVAATIATATDLPELRLTLQDAAYPLQVTLIYQIDSANDLIIRHTVFSNQGQEPITLERTYSATWHLPRQFAARRLTTLAGHWGGETRVQQRPLVAETVQLSSHKGITSGNAYPWFAIDTQANEEQGEVYFGTLAWSGNWQINIATNIVGATIINGGIDEQDFAWRLDKGASFATPVFVAGFTNAGMNGIRQRLHNYTRQHVLPQPQVKQPRPVLYNSWEATFFDVMVEGQSELAEHAARLGVELFVVDDGWFPGRISDHAGLGDWRIDPKKFPHGLKPLIDKVHALGMDFGLWVEPEMVNPDSDLYRAHPDWIYHFPKRTRHESRNQLVLNVSRSDVQAYLIDVLDRLISENEISFIKWDMNRPISEPGWPAYNDEHNEVREIWVRHVMGVYHIMDTLRQRHPGLSIESCASGGARADLGILKYTDQVWSSDNTHPDARLLIQEGISYILPGRTMGDWVTDTPADRQVNEIPLRYRFHVAMMGMLGIGGHLAHWSAADMDEAARWIAVYKRIRHLVQDGEQHWLIAPSEHEGNLAAVECHSTNLDEAVILAYRRSNPFWEPLPRLRMQHLLAEAQYTIQELGRDDAPQIEMSGAALMSLGIELPLGASSYESCLLHIKRS
jgi:Alpha-galactosidase